MRSRTRNILFWLGLSAVLALPVPFWLVYETDVRRGNLEQYGMRQQHLAGKIGLFLQREHEHFSQLADLAARAAVRSGLDAALEPFLEAGGRPVATVAGLYVVRGGTLLAARENGSRFADQATALAWGRSPAGGGALALRGSNGGDGIQRLALVRPLDAEETTRLVVFLEVPVLVERVRGLLALPQTCLLVLSRQGTRLFAAEPGAGNLAAPYLAWRAHLVSAYGAGALTETARHGTPATDRSAGPLLGSERALRLGAAEFTLALITPEKAVLERFHRPYPHMLLLLAFVVALTGYLGYVYYKTRSKALLAAEQAGVIAKLELTNTELHQAQKRYTTLFDSIIDGILLLSADGRIIECNQAFLDMLGYDDAELKGTPQRRITPPKWWGQDETRTLHLQNWGFLKDYEKEYIRKDGSTVPVVVNASYIQEEAFESERLILMSLKDISATRRAEKEIEKLHRRLQDIIESSPSAILTLDDELAITSLNSSAEQFFDIKRNQVLRRALLECIPFFRKYEEWLKKTVAEQRSLSLSAETFVLKGPDEKSANITFYPLHAEETGGVAIHLEDITEQVRLERQLFQSQKMEALGTLASGFAHDFNNLLAGLFAHVSVLRMKTADPSSLETIGTIQDIGKRASSLVQHILTFSRTGSVRAQAFDLGDVVTEVLAILQRSIGKNISIANHAAGKTIHAMGDQSQVIQVLMNLCINARDAMPDGGTLTIELEEVEIREEDAHQFRMLKPGQSAKLTVSDTGLGIPYDIQDRIFDPFFTTKSKGKGTGLGLSIVYGILRNHHGDINVVSIPGKGTAVSIYLPLAAGPPEAVLPPSVPPEDGPQRRDGTLLVIDDEAVIFNALKESFTHFGYRVFTAEDGKKGLSIFKEHRIDLVILDMLMPGLSGEEVFDLLKKENPRVRVLIHTGYTQPEDQQRMLEKGALAIIKKPCDIMELERVVRSLLLHEAEGDERPAP